MGSSIVQLCQSSPIIRTNCWWSVQINISNLFITNVCLRLFFDPITKVEEYLQCECNSDWFAGDGGQVGSRQNTIPFMEQIVNAIAVDPMGKLVFTSFKVFQSLWFLISYIFPEISDVPKLCRTKWRFGISRRTEHTGNFYRHLTVHSQLLSLLSKHKGLNSLYSLLYRSEVSCLSIAPSTSFSSGYQVLTGSRDHYVKLYEVPSDGSTIAQVWLINILFSLSITYLSLNNNTFLVHHEKPGKIFITFEHLALLENANWREKKLVVTINKMERFNLRRQLNFPLPTTIMLLLFFLWRNIYSLPAKIRWAVNISFPFLSSLSSIFKLALCTSPFI